MYRPVGFIEEEPLMIVDDPVVDRCEVQPGMCITQTVHDYLRQVNCNVPRVRGYNTRGGLRGMGLLGGGLGKICTLYTGNQINSGMLDRGEFDPCAVKRANLPICAPRPAPTPPAPPVPDPPVQTFDEPVLEEEEEESSNYMVGGILAVLVLGGVGYAVMRNRKKGKKKKGRR